MDLRRSIGELGENYVCDRLLESGWTVIERNARTRFGELDVVAMTPSRDLVFVEVKTRRAGAGIGPLSPAEAVVSSKARRIRRLAAAWLQAHGGHRARSIRFDVAGVEVDGAGCPRIVQYIPAAF